MNLDNSLVEEFKKVVLPAYENCVKLDKNIQNKELNDIVTSADIYMERKIIKKIKELFPEHTIFSEESGVLRGESAYSWYIDPIDGTINFAAGIPLYSTTLALRKNDETIFGMVFDFCQNDIYYAFDGKGCFCNDKKLKVSENTELKNSIISFCLTSHYSDEHIKDVLKVEEKLASRVRGLRLIVSTAIEMCWCASGKIDGIINVKPSRGLGSAAGKLFIKEAGGKITNLNGLKNENIDTICATNGKIHNKLISVLNLT